MNIFNGANYRSPFDEDEDEDGMNHTSYTTDILEIYYAKTALEGRYDD